MIVAAILIVSAGAAFSAWFFSTNHPERYNVVLIIVDTLRQDHLGVYGYGRDTTPNIDHFAERATVFDEAYSHTPWTKPSIASILTSLHPRAHGIEEWRDPLREKHLTLAQHLKTYGYQTKAAVSHVILDPRYGFSKGFDDYDWSVVKGLDPSKVISSPAVTDYGIRAVDAMGEKPTFLWLHYFDPHSDYFNHAGFQFGESKSRLDRYDSEVAFTDHHVGRLLDHIKAKGLLDDTVIVIVSDHGEEFDDHGGWLHGRTVYDESVKIPLIIHVPGFGAGRIDKLVAEIDLAPTLCELVGVPTPRQFAGKAIPSAYARFNPKNNRRIYLENFLDDNCKQGVRTGNWKIIRNCAAQPPSFELYHLKRDPKEIKNLYRRNKEKAKIMTERLNEVYASLPTAQQPNRELPQELEEQLKGLGYLQ